MRKPWLCHPSPIGGGVSAPGESPILENDIKRIIVTDPTIHQQGSQGTPTNGPLVQLSTKRFCQQAGDQTCLLADRNFKILSVQTAQNASGDWVSNGTVQNISPNSLEQVIATLHLYDCSGRVVGYTEGFTIPYNLNSTQTALFNQTISPGNLTGTPKFFRVSFDLGSVSNSTAYNNSTGYNAMPPVSNNSTAYNNSTGYNNAMPPVSNNSTAYNNSTGYNNAMPPVSNSTGYNNAMPPVSNSTGYNNAMPPVSNSTGYNNAMPPVSNSTGYNNAMPPVSNSTAYNNAMPPVSNSTAYNNSTGYNNAMPPVSNSTGYNNAMPPVSNSTGYNNAMPPVSNSTGYNNAMPPVSNSTGYNASDRPWVGITGSGITPAFAQRFSLPSNYGVFVDSVQPGSPADKAGLQGITRNLFSNITTVNDIIIGIDGHPVRTMHEMINYINSQTQIGDEVVLTVNRHGQIIDLNLLLQPRPPIFTYQNAKYGVKMQYPTDWTPFQPLTSRFHILSTFSLQNETTVAVGRLPIATVQLRIYNLSSSMPGLSNILHDVLEGWRLGHIEIVDSNLSSTLAGQPAFMIVGTAPDKYGFQQKFIETGTILGSKMYSLVARIEANQYAKYMPVVEKMITSFTISFSAPAPLLNSLGNNTGTNDMPPVSNSTGYNNSTIPPTITNQSTTTNLTANSTPTMYSEFKFPRNQYNYVPSL